MYDIDVIDGATCFPDEAMGGYKSRIAIIRKCDVTAIPQRKENAQLLAMGDRSLMVGTFAFKATARPIFVDAIEGTIKYTAGIQGNLGSKNFLPAAEFSVKDKEEADELASALLNVPCYVVIEEYDGRQLMIGNSALKATIDPSFDSGAAPTDERKYTFIVNVLASFRAKQYLETPINMEIDTPYVPYPNSSGSGNLSGSGSGI